MNGLVEDYAIWLDRNVLDRLERGEKTSLDQYIKETYGEDVYNKMLAKLRELDSI